MGQPPVLRFLHTWLTSTRSTNFSKRIKSTVETAKRTLRKLKFVHNSFPSCSRHYRNNLPGRQERFLQFPDLFIPDTQVSENSVR